MHQLNLTVKRSFLTGNLVYKIHKATEAHCDY